MSSPTFTNQAIAEKPEDFDRFWQDTVDSLNNYAKEFEIKPQQQRTTIKHCTIKFNSWNNTAIQGYCLHWNDAQPRPLIIYTPGYNGQYNIEWPWAELGFNVFGFDSRGFGRSDTATHKDGWILTGINSNEDSILRGAICDFIRATEIARLITPPPILRTLYYGYSFGGAMALMSEALTQAADMVAAGVPSFGWMTGRRKLVKLGSGDEINRYIRAHPDQEANIMRTLSYFDSVNFAALIKKPTLIGLGQKDVVVPAETVRAICSQLHCPLVVREFPFSHSNQPEEQLWRNFDKEWQAMARTGQLPSI